jgi:integrase
VQEKGIVLRSADEVDENDLLLVELACKELRTNIPLQEAVLEARKRFWERVSEKLGIPLTEESIENGCVPPEVYAEALDEVYGRRDNLIRPSCRLCQHSLRDTRHADSMSRATELLNEYTSANTKRAHMGDLIYWQAWLSGTGFDFRTPITKEQIIAFIVQHAEGLDPTLDARLVEQGYKQKLGPHKLSTIQRRIASLSVFLNNARLDNPCHCREAKQLLQKLAKKHGTSRAAGKAITLNILNDMLHTCGEKLIDIRDSALLLFAWGSGGRRRAEVASAMKEDLVETAENGFIYRIPKSKTDQEGKGQSVPIKGRAAVALRKWLTASGVTEGALFRSVGKAGEVRGALQPTDVHRIVRRRLKAAHYDERQFGAHSLRSGFVTEGGRRGKPLGDIMAMTGHRSVNTAMRYYQAGAIVHNSAANLAD